MGFVLSSCTGLEFWCIHSVVQLHHRLSDTRTCPLAASPQSLLLHPRDHPSPACDWVSLSRTARVGGVTAVCASVSGCFAPSLRLPRLGHMAAGVRTSFCCHMTCHRGGQPHFTLPIQARPSGGRLSSGASGLYRERSCRACGQPPSGRPAPPPTTVGAPLPRASAALAAPHPRVRPLLPGPSGSRTSRASSSVVCLSVPGASGHCQGRGLRLH